MVYIQYMNVFSFKTERGGNTDRNIYVIFRPRDNPQFQLSISDDYALSESEVYRHFAHKNEMDMHKIFEGHFEKYYSDLKNEVNKLDYGEW